MSRVAAQLEKKGMPVVLESFEDPGINKTAKLNFMRQGVPAIREVLTPQDTTLKSLPKEYTLKFIDALTRPLTQDETASGIHEPPRNEGVFMSGTYDEVQKTFEGELVCHPSIGPIAEMTDGLPITPPTEKRVSEMLKGTSHDPDEPIEFTGFWNSAKYLATVKKVAINAVMAGCKPEYMPVALAIAEAGGCVGYPGDSSFGHMFVVSGPIAREIGMNSGFCFLAPGNPANMTLQRVAALIGINLGGAIFGINVLERTGPLHWGTIFAEDENTPWEGLNEHFGYRPDESVLLSWEGKVQLVPFQNIEVKSAETLQENQVGTPEHAVAALKTLTNVNGAILSLTPDTACFWKDEYGFNTMRDLQEYMYEHVTWKQGVWAKNYWLHKLGMGRQSGYFTGTNNRPDRPADYEVDERSGTECLSRLPKDTDVPKFVSPRAVTVIVAGGTGNAWTWGGAYGRPLAYSIDKWR
ncbi:MAG: hypothetical protein JW896_03760 [Deltaproteobacteria bacterium]|nr:hypothetical protein [Deltaproteobacteria bacterium]